VEFVTTSVILLPHQRIMNTEGGGGPLCWEGLGRALPRCNNVYCMWNFTGQKFRRAQLLCIVESFGWINFHQCIIDYIARYIVYECTKGCHILYAIITPDKKLALQNFRQWEQVGKWQKFSPSEIFHVYYVKVYLCYPNVYVPLFCRVRGLSFG
jgi:hypothetical protein